MRLRHNPHSMTFALSVAAKSEREKLRNQRCGVRNEKSHSVHFATNSNLAPEESEIRPELLTAHKIQSKLFIMTCLSASQKGHNKGGCHYIRGSL